MNAKQISLIMVSVYLMMVSCSNDESTSNNCDRNKPTESNLTQPTQFTLISIAVVPSFHKRLRLIINIKDSTLVAYVPFNDSIAHPPPPPPELEDKYPYQPFIDYQDYCIKLSKANFDYLVDSILLHLDTIDFNSHYLPTLDGIGGEYIYAKSNGQIHSSYVSNAFTRNQINLLTFCFNVLKQDSLNAADSTLYHDIFDLYSFRLYPEPSH